MWGVAFGTDWRTLASGAQNMITGQWWIAFFPGVALGLTVLGFALIGDAFERYFTQGR